MTVIDSDIILLFKRSPQQLVRVKFVFDQGHEYFKSNAIQTNNDLGIFGSIIHFQGIKDNQFIIDATVQSFLCEKLAGECISLKEIRKA